MLSLQVPDKYIFRRPPFKLIYLFLELKKYIGEVLE
jgi:hypothetical protein